MQFREVVMRVQCFASYYDKETKRTRQKQVWTLDRYGQNERKPTADALTPADFGTSEQRQGWADEIAKYIDERNAAETKKNIEVLPFLLKSSIDKITADLRSKTSHLDNPFIKARMRGEVKRLGKALGLIVTTPPKPTKKKEGTADAK
jgi:hypothetical protein